VAVFGHPGVDAACVLLATASIGAIYVGLNPKHQLAELRHVLGDSEPKLLLDLADPEHHETLEVLRRASGSVTAAAARHPRGASWADFADMADRPAPQGGSLVELRRAVDSDDPLAMVYTAGSTGAPKGALLAHRSLIASYVWQAERWFDTPPTTLGDLPINHLAWVGDLVCAILVAGGTLHCRERFSAEATPAVIEQERVDYWFSVTAMMIMVTRSSAWSSADLGSLRRIVWAGAGAPRRLVETLSATGAVVSTSYGSTETCGNVTYIEDDASLDVLCTTVGRPHDGLEVRIAADDGRTCPVGEEGEILVRGPTVFSGYFGRADDTARAIDMDGWLHTGDLGRERADGYLELAGRRHDMFKSGGYNVYPREIEIALERHPEVAMAAVVSVPHPLWGEVGHAFVKPVAGSRLTSAAVEDHARSSLANYKIPKRFTIRHDLPLLPVGKVDKRALSREAQGPSEEDREAERRGLQHRH
jgi:acyl-CoA synthetase (AMP-forming)/AMP-acid ligase II